MHRFQIAERIGNGSYSEVFKAVEIATGKPCALKIMKHPWDAVQRHQQLEVSTLKMFADTPSVIHLQESFLHEGMLVLVFELLEVNLIDYYKAAKTEHDETLSEPEIRSIIFQIGLALQSMHRQGYAHRDIKPENVLIAHQQDGRVIAKLVDFGLAKKLQKADNTNYIATRWYRSPELLLSMNYDLSVDIFALGCLMVELYIGFEAFPGADAIDQLNKIFAILGTPTDSTWPEGVSAINEKRILFPQYEPVQLSENIPNISEEGLDVVGKMLVNNPNDRISIDEFLKHPYFNEVEEDLPSAVLEYVRKNNTQQPPVDNGASRESMGAVAPEVRISESSFLPEPKLVESMIHQETAEDPQPKESILYQPEEPTSPPKASGLRIEESREDQAGLSFPFMEPLSLSNLQEPAKLPTDLSGQATAENSQRTSIAPLRLFNYGQTYQNHINQSLTDRASGTTQINSLSGATDRSSYLHYPPAGRTEGARNGIPISAVPSVVLNLHTVTNPTPALSSSQQQYPWSKPAFNFNVNSFRQSPVNQPVRSPVQYTARSPVGPQTNNFFKSYRPTRSPVEQQLNHSNSNNSSLKKSTDMSKLNYTIMANNIIRSHRQPQKVITPRSHNNPFQYDANTSQKRSSDMRQQLVLLQPTPIEQLAPSDKIPTKKQPSLNITLNTYTKPMRPQKQADASVEKAAFQSNQPKQSKKPGKRTKKLELTTRINRNQLFSRKPSAVGEEGFCCNTFCRSGSQEETIIQPKKQRFEPAL